MLNCIDLTQKLTLFVCTTARNEMEIPVFKVNQWLSEWDNVLFDGSDENGPREKPKPYFFLFTLEASTLKRLSKVYPRKADETRAIEIGVQRGHEKSRSEEISNFIKVGYPLSEILKGREVPEDNNDLRMPGWLPTAIVANILEPGNFREGVEISESDLIRIEDGVQPKIILPTGASDPEWIPTVPPIEIIDGQHRLWAFDNPDADTSSFQLPVVAFCGLDITWQAYLFYTINIKPKKINRSLAFDLYPLLRVQEWLEKAPGAGMVYRETRAQELTEILWSYPQSPWYRRINMLGETGTSHTITQAAFIRSLIASFIKTSASKTLGGLFGAILPDEQNAPLDWNRTQQAALLVFAWKTIYEKITTSTGLEWIEAIKRDSQGAQLQIETIGGSHTPIFFHDQSLISSDQGVRGFLHVINDFLFKLASQLGLREIPWKCDQNSLVDEQISFPDLEATTADIAESSIGEVIAQICQVLLHFDWRSSSSPSLTQEEKLLKMTFKGSSGYKQIRKELLGILTHSENEVLSRTAHQILADLN